MFSVNNFMNQPICDIFPMGLLNFCYERTTTLLIITYLIYFIYVIFSSHRT